MGQALIVSKILFVCLCSGSRGGQQRKYSGSESFIPQKRGFRCTSGGRRTSKENLHVVSISLVRVTALSYPEPLCFIHLSTCTQYELKFSFSANTFFHLHVCIPPLNSEMSKYLCLFLCLFCDIKVYFEHEQIIQHV